MTRKRVARHPGAAWVAAVVGAWLAAVACRTMQADVAAGSAPPATAAGAPGRGRARPPSASASSRRSSASRSARPPTSSCGATPRAGRPCSCAGCRGRPSTRRAPGGCACWSRGRSWSSRRCGPRRRGDLLQGGWRAATGACSRCARRRAGRLTVVNVVNLEDYLRGVVPNELAPRAFPQIEALKAQAVAARTYALAHLGDYSSKGYDVCATAACQVYRGRGLRAPPDRPGGRGDERGRGDVAGSTDQRVLHVHLRRAHRGGQGDLRGRRPLPAGRGLPDRALLAPHGADELGALDRPREPAGRGPGRRPPRGPGGRRPRGRRPGPAPGVRPRKPS